MMTAALASGLATGIAVYMGFRTSDSIILSLCALMWVLGLLCGMNL